MKHKKYSMSLTEDERCWFHDLAKAEEKSIPFMIIECFRKKSERLGILFPETIIPDHKRVYREDYHSSINRTIGSRKISEEDFQLNFL